MKREDFIVRVAHRLNGNATPRFPPNSNRVELRGALAASPRNQVGISVLSLRSSG